jgi:hypothetical protein
MTLKEMKQKVLALIEELNPQSDFLTDDPDIATKINDVINQVIFELVRMKKLPGYVEMEVKEGDLITYDDIEKAGKYAVYQLSNVRGVEYELKAQGTMLKIRESGTAEIEYYKYPETITSTTKDNYEFELPQDILEIAPYGIAGDLLKSDISTNYGAIYSQRYETMLQRLDPRYLMGTFTIEYSVDI